MNATVRNVELTMPLVGPKCSECDGRGYFVDNSKRTYDMWDVSVCDCLRCNGTGRTGLPVKMMLPGLSMLGEKQARYVDTFRDATDGIDRLKHSRSNLESDLMMDGLRGDELKQKLDEAYPLLAQIEYLEIEQ